MDSNKNNDYINFKEANNNYLSIDNTLLKTKINLNESNNIFYNNKNNTINLIKNKVKFEIPIESSVCKNSNIKSKTNNLSYDNKNNYTDKIKENVIDSNTYLLSNYNIKNNSICDNSMTEFYRHNNFVKVSDNNYNFNETDSMINDEQQRVDRLITKNYTLTNNNYTNSYIMYNIGKYNNHKSRFEKYFKSNKTNNYSDTQSLIKGLLVKNNKLKSKSVKESVNSRLITSKKLNFIDPSKYFSKIKIKFLSCKGSNSINIYNGYFVEKHNNKSTKKEFSCKNVEIFSSNSSNIHNNQYNISNYNNYKYVVNSNLSPNKFINNSSKFLKLNSNNKLENILCNTVLTNDYNLQNKNCNIIINHEEDNYKNNTASVFKFDLKSNCSNNSSYSNIYNLENSYDKVNFYKSNSDKSIFKIKPFKSFYKYNVKTNNIISNLERCYYSKSLDAKKLYYHSNIKPCNFNNNSNSNLSYKNSSSKKLYNLNKSNNKTFNYNNSLDTIYNDIYYCTSDSNLYTKFTKSNYSSNTFINKVLHNNTSKLHSNLNNINLNYKNKKKFYIFKHLKIAVYNKKFDNKNKETTTIIHNNYAFNIKYFEYLLNISKSNEFNFINCNNSLSYSFDLLKYIINSENNQKEFLNNIVKIINIKPKPVIINKIIKIIFIQICNVIINDNSGKLFILNLIECLDLDLLMYSVQTIDIVKCALHGSSSNLFLIIEKIKNRSVELEKINDLTESKIINVIFNKLDNNKTWIELILDKKGKNLVEYVLTKLFDFTLCLNYNDKINIDLCLIEKRQCNINKKLCNLFNTIDDNITELCKADFSTFAVQKYIENYKRLSTLIKLSENLLKIIVCRNGVFVIICALKTYNNINNEIKINNNCNYNYNKQILIDKIIENSHYLSKDVHCSTLVEHILKFNTKYSLPLFIKHKKECFLGKLIFI